MIPFDPATLDIDAMLKRLHLANARRCWPQLTEQAAAEQWSHRDFLATLLAEEIGHRHGTRLRRASHDAHFPFLKTVDDFDLTQQTAIRPALLGNYLGPDFVTEGRNLILMGKTGRGKTHLAIAFAYRAIQNGFTALFTTAAALIDDLSAASRDGRLRDSLLHYLQPHVLVVDEVGYLTYGPDAANVLFHVVNDRHLKKRPIIFTTNKSPLTAWGAVLHDHDLAEAIVDRTLERGRLLLLDGPSYRTRHLPPLDSSESNDDHADQPARVSGKDRPNFPEPTIHYLNQQPAIVGRLDTYRADGVTISIVSVAELYEGVYGSIDPAASEETLQQFLRGVQVLSVDEAVARRFGQERAHLRATGQLIGDVDLLIGATAITQGLTLLTNNRRHFERLEGLLIESVTV